jgi:hypothetical protein
LSERKFLDPFTERRVRRFIEEFRVKTGQLPTLRDFQESGITEDVVKGAIKAKLIEERYVTLTSGTIVKGYVLL